MDNEWAGTWYEHENNTPDDKKIYYVYIWFERNQIIDIPFYVGMGHGTRCEVAGHNEVVTKYFKTHDCYYKIVAERMSCEFAREIEYHIKKALEERGFKIIDAEDNMKQRKERVRQAVEDMPIVNGKRVSKKTGRPFGRPKANVDMEVFKKFLKNQKDGKITVQAACNQMGICRATWYEICKRESVVQ